MTLTELSIKRPSFVIVIFAALAMLAVFGYQMLNYELLPNINIPWIVVSTVYPGASPSEVENGVTKPIEDALSGLEKVSRIISSSYEGVSVISIEFDKTADTEVLIQEAQRRVNQISLDLPKGIRQPVFQKISLSETPIMQIGATSNLPSREFYRLVKDQIQPALARVEGVGLIDLTGGEEREIKINLDGSKLEAYHISIAAIAYAVNSSNLDFPTGKIQGENRQFVVRVAGKFSSLDELRNLVVGASPEGSKVRLRDVAEVEDGIAEVKTISRINGIPTIGIALHKQSDANAVRVSRLIKEDLQKLEKQYLSIHLKFDIAHDQSTFTLEAAQDVQKDLLIAILLVAIVMFLFLHSIRNSLIVMVAIPASLTASFVVMWAFNFSLNLMTLLALSLVIGILVDDSIVVLENIHHHLEKGEDKHKAALFGRNEIGFAAVSITFVDVVVFVPLALVAGLVGDIMREFAIVITASTLTSLFVSFTITPLLASRFSKLETTTSKNIFGKIASGFENIFKSIVNRYLVLLKWSLHNTGKVITISTVLFFGAIALPAIGLIGGEFMKQSDQGEFGIEIQLPPGSTLENTNRVTHEIERLIAALPETKKILSNVGKGPQNQLLNNESQLVVTLVPKDDREKSTDDVIQQIKQITRRIPGIKLYVSQLSITGESGEAPIQVFVAGINTDSILTTSERVAAALRGTDGITDIKFSSEKGNPETRIDINRQKIAELGLTVMDVGTTLQVALTGNDDSKYREGSNDYPIRIALDKFDRTSMDDIGNLSFTNAFGKQIQLEQFADVYQTTGPTKLERQNRNPSAIVSAFTDGTVPNGTIVTEFQKKFNNNVALGTSISLEGDEKMRSEGMDSLMLALIAAITFVYFIMVLLFDSFIYPFIVLFSIPLALIGALAALALTGNAISIFSMLGVIMMIGLVAKNAILLVDRTNEQRTSGHSLDDALIEAGNSRIRPIFMTTLTMVFGMLPIATAAGAGSEWKNGLAWALIGGLTSSMFLTLVVVPVVYLRLEKLKTGFAILFKNPYPVHWINRLKKKSS
jgi:HAE1 family hydrophobic/amphiphilic exporter-1